MPLACLIAALALLLPASASAASDMDVSIMDDQLLLDEQDPAVVDRHMSRFRSLGVDRLRVSAFWDQIAPGPTSSQKPTLFNAASPVDPAYNFSNLDRVVRSARGHGLKVMISITTPAPRWATGDPARDDHQWKPKPDEFALFARAIASRYGPDADQFAILNEPNQPGWLQPQSNRGGFYAPHHYRRLVLAAFPAIRAASPSDEILVGELAASGSANRGPNSGIRPLAFLRAFGCVSRSFRKVRSGRCRGFRKPRADSIGHHPYQFFIPPGRHSPHRDDAAIGDGRRLLRFIDRLVRRGGLASARGGKLDVHYTEFGYQTDPPDPYAGLPLKRQDRWLQEAARIAWATPRVHTHSQFRLTDGPVHPGGGFDAYREFQTGLMFRDMRKKPSYDSFRSPFVVKRPRQPPAPVGPGSPRQAPRGHGRAQPGPRLEEGPDRPDDPARLLAAQDPQALGDLSVPVGRRLAAHERPSPRRLGVLQGFLQDRGTSVRARSYLPEHMFPTALQRLRLSLRGGVALAVEFATLGELVPEYREPELPGDDSGRSAGRLIREQTLPAVRPSTAAARARLERRGTVTAVEPECAERLRAPSRQPRRRRPSPPAPAQPCG